MAGRKEDDDSRDDRDQQEARPIGPPVGPRLALVLACHAHPRGRRTPRRRHRLEPKGSRSGCGRHARSDGRTASFGPGAVGCDLRRAENGPGIGRTPTVEGEPDLTSRFHGRRRSGRQRSGRFLGSRGRRQCQRRCQHRRQPGLCSSHGSSIGLSADDLREVVGQRLIGGARLPVSRRNRGAIGQRTWNPADPVGRIQSRSASVRARSTRGQI